MSGFSENRDYFHEQTEDLPQAVQEKDPNIEENLVAYVENNTGVNNIMSVLTGIDKFCSTHWMMNIGPEKGQILINALRQRRPKTILEIGCYCGYSSLLQVCHSDAMVFTLDVNPMFAQLASRIHRHAGVEERIRIIVGKLKDFVEELKAIGPFDLIFIDHWKVEYLSDLKLMEESGLIQAGCCVVADNIIYPGAPDYLEYMKNSSHYNSVLYHSYLEYSKHPDAVLVSTRID